MVVKMYGKDHLAPAERSALMAKIKSKGNKSTESAVASILRAERISGWRKHPTNVRGNPDFYFPKAKLALFVDGCFWHACPSCQRNVPTARREFWSKKIDDNRRRDNRTRRALRFDGFRVFRIWEHAVADKSWLRRLRAALEVAEGAE